MMVNSVNGGQRRLDEEHAAAIVWTQITEGGDKQANNWIEKFGYAQGLSRIRNSHNSQNMTGYGSAEVVSSVKRWKMRLESLAPFDTSVLAKLGISIVIPGDEYWPEQLEDLGSSKPIALWVRGNPGILRAPMVSIVGSRDASSLGMRTTLEFAHDLAKDFVVVSGGAFGIDAWAHKGALSGGGKTIVVSAGGVDRSYPKANHELFTQVLKEDGAIISESPLAAAPQRYRFLARNRIIAALGSGTIVVEASFRSGALNTARHALAIGREVGAIPGSVESHFSAGCNELIRNGGTLLMNPSHAREMLGSIGQLNIFSEAGNIDCFAGAGADDGYDADTERVFDAVPLRKGASTESIARLAGVNVEAVRSILGKLLLARRVEHNLGLWVKRGAGGKNE
ncbi:DNA processing protein [Arcanobacterium pluranimalium]|uniref:DNA-processing protein DprA n=1 Tax=Arcanobacterium pluranimalium TaxID=108028 RepID=UPI00195911C6|nr:DNA-processing protein DprA [Arcanobacterium pluranimalium]MBM7825663.1 DNA processing protein [Arcanobacterium pluranimalium]